MWTNAECLLRAHEQRCGVSPAMRKHADPQCSKVAINGGDNASVNFKQNRAQHKTLLKDFEAINIGCRVHGTAIAKNRGIVHLCEFIVTGQVNWALTLNRGQTMQRYKRCVHKVAMKWMHIQRGTPQFSNARGQRQLMSLIFQPHSYVVSLRNRPR